MKILLTAAVTAACTMSFALAAEEIKPEAAAPAAVPVSLLQKCDANKDGVVTDDEAHARRAAWMQEMDADKDGKLQGGEFRTDTFKAMDTDKDGVVTVEEYMVFFTGDAKDAGKTASDDAKKAHAKKHWFQKRDANGDNKADKDEFAGCYLVCFTMIDINGDKKISADEMAAANAKDFKDLDANGDGVVIVEEFMMIPALPAPPAAAK